MKFRPFEEVFEIPLRNGLTKPKKVRGAGFKMINMGELFRVSRMRNIPMDRVPLNEKEKASSMVEAGDLLFARQSLVREGAGQCSIFLEDEEDVCFESHLIRCRLNKEIANPLFYYYYFSSRTGKLVMDAIIEQGAGASGIRGSDLAKVLVPDVDKNIQDKIAEVCDQIDSKIELNRQTNQTLEQIAQTIFKSWFVDFEPVNAKIEVKQNGQDPERAAMRAIGGKTDEQLDQLSPEYSQQLAASAAFFPSEFEDSELGEVPKGWGWMSLYETAVFINGAAFKSSDFSSKDEGLPIIKIAELKAGIIPQTKYTIKDVADKYIINNDEMLYSWSGSPRTSLEVFKWFGGKAILNQHIFRVITDTSENKYFVYYLLRYLKPQLIAIAENKQTTGLGHVTVADMKRLKIPQPETNILKEFARVVGSIYENSSMLERQILTLTETRDVVLPKLLDGELDLSVETAVVRGMS